MQSMPSSSSGAPPLPPYLLLAITVAILGFNWPLLSIALDSIGPWWLTAFRLLGATLVVWAVAAGHGVIRRPPRGDYPILFSIAIVRLLGVLVLVLLALTAIPAGRSSVLVWTASLWTVPIAWVFLREQMTPRRWAGLAVGILGILVLVEPWRQTLNSGQLIGYGLLVAAAISNAGTSVHARGHKWLSTPLQLLPWQLVIATIPATATAWIVEGPPIFHWTPLLASIIVYEGILATSLAVWCQLTVLQHLPSITTNFTLMLVPVLGVASSAVVLGEALTTTVVLGGSLIALGVATSVGLGEFVPIPTSSGR